jgi:glycosyltransferase involved in cell wall biosynthesis
VKVVQLCPSTAYGGTEAVSETLHHQAALAGWHSEWVIPVARGAAPTVVRWRPWALSQRLQADVVHAHLPSPDRLGTALMTSRGHRLVVTFHLLPHGEPWPRDRFTKLPTAHLLRVAALRPRTIWVALSEHDRQQLRPMLGERPRVVMNAPPEPAQANPVDWPADGLRLASVGRLHPQKGFDRMLQVLAHPDLAGLRWQWVVAGEGPQRAELESLRDRLALQGRVRFVGSRPAADVLQGADLLLSPSRYEGMPLVPLEAAEAGLPVLASPIPAHRELLSTVPGALLPEDEAAWPGALASLLGSGAARDRLGEACARLVGPEPRRTFWRRYESLYRELMSR